MVFDAGDVVLGRPARVRIDPFRDAELGFGFLQPLGNFYVVLLGGAAGEHVGFRLGERGEGSVRLALFRLPVEAVGALDHVASEWCAFLDGRLLFWRSGPPLWRFRT